MDTTVSLWIIAILAFVALLIGCLVLMVLPNCINQWRQKQIKRSLNELGSRGDSPTVYHLEEGGGYSTSNSRRFNQQGVKDTGIGTNINVGGKISSTIHSIRTQIHNLIGQNIEPLAIGVGNDNYNNEIKNKTRTMIYDDSSSSSSSHQSIHMLQKKFKSHMSTLGFLLVGHFIISFLFWLVTFVYPPALWFFWGFFPSNSTVILAFLYLSLRCIIDYVLINQLRMFYKQVITETIPLHLILLSYYESPNDSSSKKPLSLTLDIPPSKKFTTETLVEALRDKIMYPLVIPIILQIFALVILGIRDLFLFVGTSVLWFDGAILISVLTIFDLFWVVTYFMLGF
jgi:hypothetical protein